MKLIYLSEMFVICFFFSIVSIVSFSNGQTLTGPTHGKVVVCYVGTWASYRTPPGTFSLEDVDPSLCTHLIYAFAGLDEDTSSIMCLDPPKDQEENNGQAGYKRLVALKERYPHLKITIAIGGWSEGSPKFSNMASNSESRTKFIDSVLKFLGTHKFDGLDLDWEYPAGRGGKPYDKENYVLLVKELKQTFEPHGYILTAAIGVLKDTMEAAYDFPQLTQYLDQFHMMCYDYHTASDGAFGANAALRDNGVSNVEYTIKYLLSHGVSPDKMVLGLPTYGKTFLLLNPDEEDIQFGKTPVQNQGFAGPFTLEPGFIAYNEICMELTNASSRWTYYWHNETSTPYVRDKDRIITYDNGRSIVAKVKMAIDYELAGVMVWSVDTDDFKGHCGEEKDPYVDIVKRYEKMAKNPNFMPALKSLHLYNACSHKHLVKKTSYATDDKLFHKLQHYSNYPILRTINEATTLVLEEKRIQAEMVRISKETDDNFFYTGVFYVRKSFLIFLLFLSIFAILFSIKRLYRHLSNAQNYSRYKSREYLKTW